MIEPTHYECGTLHEAFKRFLWRGCPNHPMIHRVRYGELYGVGVHDWLWSFRYTGTAVLWYAAQNIYKLQSGDFARFMVGNWLSDAMRLVVTGQRMRVRVSSNLIGESQLWNIS